jgi:predicted DNA binding CopG/RHH family protein
MAGKNRDKAILVRMSAQEVVRVTKNAEREGLPVSTYIRQAALTWKS